MHNRSSRRRREKGDKKCIWRNYGWKHPQTKEDDWYLSTGNEQDECKQTHKKTHHNWNGKIKNTVFYKQQERKSQSQEKPHKAIRWFLCENFAS